MSLSKAFWMAVAVWASALVVTAAHADEPAAAGSVINVSRTARGFSLEARDASLRDVLHRLAEAENLDLDIRGTSDPRVTATIRDASLAEALRRLVRYDFVLGVDRLIVYLRDGSPAQRGAETIDRWRSGGFRPPSRRPPPYRAPEAEAESEPEPEADE